jgi:hypothetical protein
MDHRATRIMLGRFDSMVVSTRLVGSSRFRSANMLGDEMSQ